MKYFIMFGPRYVSTRRERDRRRQPGPNDELSVILAMSMPACPSVCMQISRFVFEIFQTKLVETDQTTTLCMGPIFLIRGFGSYIFQKSSKSVKHEMISSTNIYDEFHNAAENYRNRTITT